MIHPGNTKPAIGLRHPAADADDEKQPEQQNHHDAAGRIVADVVFRCPAPEAAQVAQDCAGTGDEAGEAGMPGADKSPEDAQHDQREHGIANRFVQPFHIG